MSSSAVTVYVTGDVKSCATPEFGDTLAPVCMMVGTRLVTFVPYGTASEIVLSTSLIVPITFGVTSLKLKAVMALAGLGATNSTVNFNLSLSFLLGSVTVT